jgi:UDP-GlcNAc:undecaprenyl-phosphate GlcNAc-1-phosphate transferase
MKSALPFLLPAVTAFGLSALVTPLVARAATALGFVAVPKMDRCHRRTVPMMGGLAITAGTLVSAFAWGQGGGFPVILLIAGAMAALGLADDVMRIKPITKLTGQILIACAAAVLLPPLHWTGVLPVDALLTIFWIVGVTNALNLLDNMDGLCAGIAIVAGVALFFTVDDPFSRTMAAAVVGGAAGFLLYNFQPASIFMGDCGSLFLGSLIATLALGTERSMVRGGLLSTMAVPVLMLLLPIFDTTFVTISRKLSSRAASMGGRDHTSHRLVAMGFSERQAVLFCYGIAATTAATAVLLGSSAVAEANVLIALMLVMLMLLAVQLSRVKVYEGADWVLLRNQRYTPLLIEIMYKRRMLEVLMDLVLATTTYYAAYILRFDKDFPLYYHTFEQSVPIVVGCELAMFYVAGLYRGVWRYLGVSDLTTYAKAVVGGTIVSVAALVYLYRFENYSRAVFVINAMALTLLLLGSRLSFRVIGELAARYGAAGRCAIIYGGGDGGAVLIRELRNNSALDLRAVAFIDDDPLKKGTRILGVPVRGDISHLPALIRELNPAAVLLSTRKLPPERLASLQEICFTSGIDILRLDFKLSDLPDEKRQARIDR